LAALVDESLVRRVGQTDDVPRFAMLETIREYATELLEESSEATAVRRRHASGCSGSRKRPGMRA
jgi:predicted ATPase